MKYLLITPPLTQLNTPYPATAVLRGFLKSRGHEAAQADLGIELADRILSRPWLTGLAATLPPGPARDYAERCADTVELAKRFLRGEDNTAAPRIANRSLLPEGPRFDSLADTEWAFGTAGIEDKARYFATLFLEEAADLVREQADPHFDLVRYGEQLASFAPTFDELEAALRAPATPVDNLMMELLDAHIDRERPDAVGFAVPFPGCLYGALRCGAEVRRRGLPTVVGGGFVNTEWRQLSDPRVFDFCDYITFDDGEEPLLRLADSLSVRTSAPLVRTLTRQSLGQPLHPGTPGFSSDATPDFGGLPLDRYLSLADMANPMHRLWSCGRWNKLMMAHGCYWARCAFCDTTLDYIRRYEAPSAARVVDRMEAVMRQTGSSGFHFVDEALPPRLLAEVCEEILRRRLTLTFWGNIRFEKAYTPDLCDLMARAGCVAVSGGLEVASDRLLKLMNKGVTIDQTVRACRRFREAGIMVHTYLMYGFPTETLQETVNALEVVRQMFDEGIVQSAFWHRYAMTCHSESGIHPDRFSARRLSLSPNPFCNNEVDWEPGFDYDIEEVGRGLRIATANYMDGLGLDQPLKTWFPALRIPKPTTK